MDYDAWKLQTPEQFNGLPEHPLEEVDCEQCFQPTEIWDEDDLKEYRDKGFLVCDECHANNAENPDHEEN